MKRGIGWNPASALITLLIALSNFQASADEYVSVSIDGFWPSSVTIAPGEAVVWMVTDDQGPYSISSPAGYWLPLYLYDEGDTEALQFNQAGDYSYYDALSGNTGIVHVQNSAPNTPPTIAITNPAAGAVFTAPATFGFGSDAWDLDDGVLEVEFYVGADLIDQVFDSPYATTVTNLPAGVYTLMAVAYDFSGAATTNTVDILVQNGAGATPSLGPPRWMAGQFQFDITGLTAGKTVVIQACTDFAASTSWTSVQTNVAATGTSTFATPVSPGHRFFRILQLP